MLCFVGFGGGSMEIMGFCFEFIWNNFFEFMNWELNFGDVHFTLWEFMLGSIIIFGIIAVVIRRILQ